MLRRRRTDPSERGVAHAVTFVRERIVAQLDRLSDAEKRHATLWDKQLSLHALVAARDLLSSGRSEGRGLEGGGSRHGARIVPLQPQATAPPGDETRMRGWRTAVGRRLWVSAVPQSRGLRGPGDGPTSVL